MKSSLKRSPAAPPAAPPKGTRGVAVDVWAGGGIGGAILPEIPEQDI